MTMFQFIVAKVRVKVDLFWIWGFVKEEKCNFSEIRRFHIALTSDTSSTYRLSRHVLINYGCAFGLNACVCT